MRHTFSTRFAVVATLAVGHCSIVNADPSYKVVSAPLDSQQAPIGGANTAISVVTAPRGGQDLSTGNAGVAFKVVTSPAAAKQAKMQLSQTPAPSMDESNPDKIGGSQEPPAAVVRPTSMAVFERPTPIEIGPGYVKQIDLDWNVKDVHVGDESLITVAPVNNHTLILQAKKIPNDAVAATNFYVTSADGDKAEIYKVIIKHRPAAGEVEIHTRPSVENYLTYDCANSFGCAYPTGHQILLEPLPAGYSKQDITQDITHKER